MRQYQFHFVDGKVLEFQAEMDTIKDNVVILSKKKEQTGVVARTDVQPMIVAVVPLFNVRYYDYA